jgi:hypothetical protein
LVFMAQNQKAKVSKNIVTVIYTDLIFSIVLFKEKILNLYWLIKIKTYDFVLYYCIIFNGFIIIFLFFRSSFSSI